jgi:DNA repair photolyase
MSDQIIQPTSNVIQFPLAPTMTQQVPLPPLKKTRGRRSVPVAPKESLTPIYDSMIEVAANLDAVSNYKSNFDYEVYKGLELRFKDKPIRGGITFNNPFKLVNSHHTCQQCLYAFEVDTYGRGCAHECAYCYAKAELTVHGYWNNPIPVPISINDIRKTFYTVFETDKRNKWRSLLEKRIPLRIGSMTDSFMWSDKKYGVTKEFLKILKHYNYPNIIFTRSDLVAADEYMNVINPNLSSIQMSISSINDDMNRKIEPGAPSAKRRLAALQKLSENGYWTTVRINPLFPIHPDGYFTDPNFKWDGEVPKFDYSSFDMIDAIADAKVPAVLAGMVRFSGFALNNIQKATGADLRTFYRKEDNYKSRRDWHFSDRETRYYYEQLYIKSKKRKIEFTTCYIGNGETHFWKDQDIWSNKKDCCNAKGKVAAFERDSREITFAERLKFTGHKDLKPVDAETLHKPLTGEDNTSGLVINVNSFNPKANENNGDLHRG